MIFHHRIHPHGVRGSLNFESGEGTGMEFSDQKKMKNDEKINFFNIFHDFLNRGIPSSQAPDQNLGNPGPRVGGKGDEIPS